MEGKKEQEAKREIKAPYVPAERTFYANAAGFNVSLYDFVVDFGRSSFSGETVEDSIVRIYMSPQHAKSLFRVLGAQLAKYEETFGPIVLGEKKKERKEG